MTKIYSHAYKINFEVISHCEGADDVNDEMIRKALMKKIDHIDRTGGDWRFETNRFGTMKIGNLAKLDLADCMQIVIDLAKSAMVKEVEEPVAYAQQEEAIHTIQDFAVNQMGDD